MRLKKGRARTLGRPCSQARRVFEDWIHGLHVIGWEWSSEDLTYLTFTSAFSGHVLCTRTYLREIWQEFCGMAKQDLKKSLVERALAARGPGGGGVRAHDADWAEKYPTLHEFLTLTQLSDGTTRTTSTMTLMIEGGLFKAVLNERDTNQGCWATGETITQLLAEMEERLSADHVDWRAQKWAQKDSGPSRVDNGRSKR